MFGHYKYNFDYQVPGKALKTKCRIKAQNKKAYLDGLRDAFNAIRRERDAILREDAKKSAQKDKKTNVKKGKK